MIITGLIETSARSHAIKATRSLTSISDWKHWLKQRSGELSQGQIVHSLVWEADKEALVLKSQEAPSLLLQLPGLTDCWPQPSLSWPQLPCVAQSTSTQSPEKTFRWASVSNFPSQESKFHLTTEPTAKHHIAIGRVGYLNDFSGSYIIRLEIILWKTSNSQHS